MQFADRFSGGSFPPSLEERSPDIASQLRQQKVRHHLIWLSRSVGLWWYRILLIVLAAAIATFGGQSGYFDVKIFVGVAVGIVLFFMAIRRVEFGIVLAAIITTPLVPSIGQLKSLQLHAIELLLLILFITLMVQTAFGAREPILPSIQAIWPQIGLIIMAFVSTTAVQLTWTPGVPHKITTNPIIFDEIYGVLLYFVPLLTIIVTTAALTYKEKSIEYIQYGFLSAAAVCALIVIVRFKSIGADIYTFRFSEPSIGYMSLRALAQILALGAMIAYANFLYATRWLLRLVYSAATVACLLAVYFSLENSWWLEIGLALIIITIMFSRRLFFFFMACAIPLLPLIKAGIEKIAQVKTADYYRLIIWKDALRVWSKQPILGVGAGDFWAYDQRFTQLPLSLHNCDKTGLCVAHNGYLQLLGELGPIGVILNLSFIVVIIVIGVMLYRRSHVKMIPGGTVLDKLGLGLYVESPQRHDRVLAVICLGLICGSAAGDFFSGSFFLQPRQVGSAVGLPQVITSWIMWGCLIYKDKLWRIACKKRLPDGQVASANGAGN
jgi:O-antigen ligase